MIQLLDDKRSISTIWLNTYGWTVKDIPNSAAQLAEEIEVYGEPGLHCNIPWFAIWKEGRVVSRIPAHACDEIIYGEEL